jgi:hypothetical protein
MNRKRQKFVNSLRGLCPSVTACLFVSTLFLQTGCQPGIIAVLGTPTSAEAKNPAEYDLTAEKGKKILILVDQPSSLNAQTNMRFLLTNTTVNMLKQRAKVPPEALIDYDKLADFRANTPDFSLLAPEKIGADLGADLVLLITVNDFKISDVSKSGYANGSLIVAAELISTATGQRLWPQIEQARIVRVGFESERLGQDAAAVRLAVAAAHCVTRHLFNCPKNQFKISDEITGIGWEK